MDPSKKPLTIPEVLSLLKENQTVKEEYFPFVERILMERQKRHEEELKETEKMYTNILEKLAKEHEENVNMLNETINKLTNEINANEAYYEKQFREILHSVSILKEADETKNAADCNGESKNEDLKTNTPGSAHH
ncbi:vacuolar protein sorting-associated protein atg6-like [Capsicum chacoense]